MVRSVEGVGQCDPGRRSCLIVSRRCLRRWRSRPRFIIIGIPARCRSALHRRRSHSAQDFRWARGGYRAHTFKEDSIRAIGGSMWKRKTGVIGRVSVKVLNKTAVGPLSLTTVVSSTFPGDAQNIRTAFSASPEHVGIGRMSSILQRHPSRMSVPMVSSFLEYCRLLRPCTK